MYLLNYQKLTKLNEFANRYKKEQYKKLGTTQKQLRKDLISNVKIWNKHAGKYSQNASEEYRKWATPILLRNKNDTINYKLKTDLKLGRSKAPGFFNEDPLTRINISRRKRIEILKNKLANKTKSITNNGYTIITEAPKINPTNLNTSKALTSSTKTVLPKTKLLNKSRLAIGITAATGIGLVVANKLRKSRKDKNKKRGKYNKFK